MGAADGLTRNGPTLGGVLSPVAGVGDAGADPKDQKWPMSQNPQRPPESRTRQGIGGLRHFRILSLRLHSAKERDLCGARSWQRSLAPPPPYLAFEPAPLTN